MDHICVRIGVSCFDFIDQCDIFDERGKNSVIQRTTDAESNAMAGGINMTNSFLKELTKQISFDHEKIKKDLANIEKSKC